MRQWWQLRSLRFRLTVWYAITSAVILLGLGSVLLLVLYQRLISEADRQLRVDFETVESRVTSDSEGDLGPATATLRIRMNPDPDDQTKQVPGSKSCLWKGKYCYGRGHRRTGIWLLYQRMAESNLVSFLLRRKGIFPNRDAGREANECLTNS